MSWNLVKFKRNNGIPTIIYEIINGLDFDLNFIKGLPVLYKFKKFDADNAIINRFKFILQS